MLGLKVCAAATTTQQQLIFNLEDAMMGIYSTGLAWKRVMSFFVTHSVLNCSCPIYHVLLASDRFSLCNLGE